MTPDDAEWADPANWHLGRELYFARRDTRVFVPKAHDPRNQTLNFARGASWLILGVICLPPVMMLLAFNVKDLPDIGRRLVDRLGGPTGVTLGLFGLSFLSYGIKRYLRRRRELEALRSATQGSPLATPNDR